jgi:hypothetical protein
VYVRPQLKPSHGICSFTTTTFGAHHGADQGAGRSTSRRDLLHLLGGSTSASPASTAGLLHLPGLTSTRPGQHTAVPDLHRHLRAGTRFILASIFYVLAGIFYILADIFYILAGIFYILASIFYVLAGIFYILASIFYVLAGIFYILASIFYVLDGIFYILAGIYYILAGIFYVLASIFYVPTGIFYVYRTRDRSAFIAGICR